MVLVRALRRVGALVCTLASFLIAPAIMLIVCFGVCALVVCTQFLFVLPAFVGFASPLVIGFTWIQMKSRKQAESDSVGTRARAPTGLNLVTDPSPRALP